ncbi:MAG: DUF6308 family protein [Ilumatobacteraceae bacterium]
MIGALDRDVLGSGQSASELVADYFVEFAPRRTASRFDRTGFSGRYFDELALSNTDRSLSPDAIDLLAVSYLSIRIDGEMVASLAAIAGEIEELLKGVPGLSRSSSMWSSNEQWFKRESGLSLSLGKIRELEGFGDTTARKLMSAMFPHLLPVSDSVIRGVMTPVGRRGWWTSWRDVSTPALRDHLGHIMMQARTLNPSVPMNLSLLRTADIALWMADFRQGQKE